jgi:hypothetical protein
MVVMMLFMIKTKLIVVAMEFLRVVAEMNVSKDCCYIISGCNCVRNVYNGVVRYCNVVDTCVNCSGC